MADWLNLEGKVVIVTGGASGIGNHVVTTLKDAGATPVIADISVETGEERDGIFCTKCDVTSKESVEAMVAAVVEKYGKLDAIVNNAGVNLPRLLVDVQGEKPQYELDEKSFNIMFNINVKGLMYCAQAAAKQMLKQGGGVIINMSSESGKEGSQGQSAYSATKGACDSFTRSWAKELGKYNIRVVAVACLRQLHPQLGKGTWQIQHPRRGSRPRNHGSNRPAHTRLQRSTGLHPRREARGSFHRLHQGHPART